MAEKKTILVVRAVPPERKDKDGKVKRKEGEGWWPEIGRASKNKDGSLSLWLEALPVGGRAIVVAKEIEEKDDKSSSSDDDIPF